MTAPGGSGFRFTGVYANGLNLQDLGVVSDNGLGLEGLGVVSENGLSLGVVPGEERGFTAPNILGEL